MNHVPEKETRKASKTDFPQPCLRRPSGSFENLPAPRGPFEGEKSARDPGSSGPLAMHPNRPEGGEEALRGRTPRPCGAEGSAWRKRSLTPRCVRPRWSKGPGGGEGALQDRTLREEGAGRLRGPLPAMIAGSICRGKVLAGRPLFPVHPLLHGCRGWARCTGAVLGRERDGRRRGRKGESLLSGSTFFANGRQRPGEPAAMWGKG